MSFLDQLFSKKNTTVSIDEFPYVQRMCSEILNGPLATINHRPDSDEYIHDGYHRACYEDDLICICSLSETGVGMGRASGSRYIQLKQVGIYGYNPDFWYNHLLDVYNKSNKIKEREYNLNHKVRKIFQYVPSGYSDGIIKVEYEEAVHSYYSESEAEEISRILYNGKIFLIPLGECVYDYNEIKFNKDYIKRPGEWVDYVSCIIDEFEEEKHLQAKKESESRRTLRKTEEKQKIRRLKNTSPIDDTNIFK